MDRIKKAFPHIFAAFALGTMCILVYWPVLHQEFINFDDPLYVSLNPHVKAGLTAESAGWAFNIGYASNFHPITWVSHMLDVHLFGVRSGLHKLTNVVFHTANSILLFFALLSLACAGKARQGLSTLSATAEGAGSHARLTPWTCFFVAALFAVHPLHVESVAWVSERKDVLSAFFFMLTLLAYAKYSSSKSQHASLTQVSGFRPQVSSKTQVSGFRFQLFYFLSLLSFAFGLMSKPMLVTVPFVLLLLDYWPLQRITLPIRKEHIRVLLEKIPFFILTGASCVLTLLAQKHAMVEQTALPAKFRVANVLASYVVYIWQTIWPADLAPFYPYRGQSAEMIVAGIAVLLMVTAAALLVARKRRWLLTGWLWYLGMLVPVIGIVQVGMQSHADRYTYLPHIGLFIIIICSAAAVLARFPQFTRPAVFLGLLLVCGLGIRANDQVKLWKDSKTLFSHAARLGEDNYQAWLCLGVDDLARKDAPSAITNLSRALEAARPFGAEPEIHYFLGAALHLQGKPIEAISHIEQAKVLPEQRAERSHLLGLCYLEAERLPEAERSLKEALALGPRSVDVQLALARALCKKGDIEQAERIARDVVAQTPGQARGNHALGSLLLSSSRPAEAQPYLEVAFKTGVPELRLAMDYAQCLAALGQTNTALLVLEKVQKENKLSTNQLMDLAACFDDLGRDATAVELYANVISLEPDNLGALNNLAWLLSTSPDDSVRNGKRAVQLARRCCELTEWKMPVLIGTLAAASAESGDFSEAVAQAEKAGSLASEQNDSVVAGRNSELLQLYKAGKPYRERR